MNKAAGGSAKKNEPVEEIESEDEKHSPQKATPKKKAGSKEPGDDNGAYDAGSKRHAEVEGKSTWRKKARATLKSSQTTGSRESHEELEDDGEITPDMSSEEEERKYARAQQVNE